MLALAPDPRPAIEVDGAYYRRSASECGMQRPIGQLWISTFVAAVGTQGSAVMASAVPMLND